MAFFFFIVLIIIAFVIVRVSRARQLGQINIPEMHASGILNKDEEIIEHFQGAYFKVSNLNGVIVFTNRRFLFLQKAQGWGSKGFNVIIFCSWGDVVSVSTTGSYKFNLNVKNNDKMLSISEMGHFINQTLYHNQAALASS